jgi:CheY-like chemotaxis protein
MLPKFAGTRASMRILVIDDDNAVGSAVKLSLEGSGAQVHYVESALAGIAALGGEDFDLAIVDIFMPKVGGLETIKLLRQIKPELPIIAMSGYMHPGNQTSAPTHMTAGSVYSLAKPFRPRDLAKAVETCLGRPLPKRSAASGAM